MDIVSNPKLKAPYWDKQKYFHRNQIPYLLLFAYYGSNAGNKSKNVSSRVGNNSDNLGPSIFRVSEIQNQIIQKESELQTREIEETDYNDSLTCVCILF